MQIDLRDKVALITGAAGGLGRSYALALAARGAAIVVNDLGGDTRGIGASAAPAQAVVDEILAAGGSAIANYDSVATKAGGEAITQAALDAFGRIDIVINNAGNQRNARFEDITEDDIEAVLAVHLKGAFYVTQPAYRLMKRQGSGRIILTGSQSGIFGNPYRANYGSAKTAMIGLMNVIAQEAPVGITVNTVFPTALGSRMGSPGETRVDADFMAAGAERFRRLPTLGTLLSPDYVTALVVYLASDECTRTQGMYSVYGSRYGRMFTGVARGWIAGAARIPTPEEVAAHMDVIDDTSSYGKPMSGFEEMDEVIERVLAKTD